MTKTQYGVEVNKQKKPEIIADDIVVSMAYILTINGEKIDSSDDSGPLEFIQGCHNIVTGLERQIYGMKIGESRKLVIAPDEGYGDVDPQALIAIPRAEFPDDLPLEVGIELDIRDEDGEVFPATVVEVNNDIVKLDFNHPLAGETLHFEVKITDLREPTQEELDHGHVHSDDIHDEDFDEEFIEYFDDDAEK